MALLRLSVNGWSRLPLPAARMTACIRPRPVEYVTRREQKGHAWGVAVIKVTDTLSIPEEEFRFKASRSSGPGGQNVNKLNTRMTLLFDVTNSPSLSQEQKESIQRRLATRINHEGVLRVVCQRYRTQAANRREATERFVEVLVDALKRRRPRRKTQISAAVKRRRREERARRSRLKRSRSESVNWDE